MHNRRLVTRVLWNLLLLNCFLTGAGLTVKSAQAATFTVTKTADTADGTCAADCSLREAVIAANSAASDDSIIVPAGTYTLTLTGQNENGSATGDLDVATASSGKLTITGAGAGTSIIQAGTDATNGIDRVFELLWTGNPNISLNSNLALSGLTLRYGRNGSGGAIYNAFSTLTLQNCSVSQNYGDTGGAIMSFGAIVTLQNSTLNGNSAAGSNGGGGIWATGNFSVVTVQNSTISGNSAASGNGGGIFSLNGVVTVQNSTLYGNSSSSGGAIAQSGATINIGNSIVAGNTATGSGPNISGAVNSQGYNLVGSTTGATINGDTTGNQLNIDPKLGPLANNGGPTLTHGLGFGSPAIDAGKNLAGLSTDQRGQARPTDFPGIASASGGDGSDIGAVEAQPNDPQSSSTVVVNTSDDHNDGACTIGDCTLREAITYTNGHAGADTINFNIPGGGVKTINLTSGLPFINQQVTIDGYSQPGAAEATAGAAATLMIELNGTNAGTAAGLILDYGSDNSTIQGLVINRFAQSGIVMQSPDNTIRGNYLGTDATGAIARGNSSCGIAYFGSSNTIGGTIPAARNVISGNDVGIGTYGTSNTLIQGNYIGLNAAGTAALANAVGISIQSAASNTIGGTSVGARNVISGNSREGVNINSSGADNNLVQGNYIGTNPAGDAAIANGYSGVYVSDGDGNTIGGTTAGSGNVLSGNTQNGVLIEGVSANNNRVEGNYIGLNAAGTAALSNAGHGVRLNDSLNNTIGGTASGAGNVISGNNNSGINIEGAKSIGNLVQGNLIGTNATGTASLGANQGNQQGVTIDGCSGNTIGGTASGARNVISGNDRVSTANGIELKNGATNNTIAGNYIGTNAAGDAAIGNRYRGVDVNNSPNNTIGGTTAAARNVISANGINGISVDGTSSNTTIQGNYIGTNAAGTANLGNSNSGISLNNTTNNTIGGTAAGAGNVISGNTGSGINIGGAGAAGNLVQGNFIGTNAAGTASIGANQGNSQGVTLNNCSGNTIGGTASGARNVISGNNRSGTSSGVEITGGASNNTVAGNYIGTNASGDAAIGNTFMGIRVSNSSNNTIGGTMAAARNIISGNATHGISIVGTSSDNSIQGNFIGTNAAGTAAIANSNYGIQLSASNNVIGGTSAGAGNLISGNPTGITVDSNPSNVRIEGNLIGTNADGTAVVPNSIGIRLQGNTTASTVGGTTAAARNVISGNNLAVLATGGTYTDSQISGNYIGTNAAGTAVLANGTGIRVEGASNLLIGGTTAGSGNLISGNSDYGVRISGTSVGNRVLGNSIYNNGRGIDLGADGVTANDNGDGDTGDNNLQNFPVLQSISGGNTINGTLNSIANTTFRIELFANTAIDGSGHGEGEEFLSATDVTTGADGNKTFSVAYTPVSGKPFITSTATNLTTGDTSEFSAALPNNPPVNNLPATQSVAEDGSLTFSTANGNAISIDDVDAGNNDVKVTLTVTNGTLSLSGITGLDFTAGDGTADTTMTFTGTLSEINAALNGSTYTPTSNFNGAASLAITTNDQGNSGYGGAKTTTDSLTINVMEVNDTPTLDAISDPTAIGEGAGTQTVNLSGISAGPPNENGQALTVTASSSDTGVIPIPTVNYTSPNSTGSISYTPVANANGTAIITVTVTDNGQTDGANDFKSITRTFTVTVNAINDEPTLDAIPTPPPVGEDAGAQTVNLTGISAGPADEAGQTLTVTASSSDTSIIPNPMVTYTSPNATGTLIYTPVANANGTATITVTVKDNGGTVDGGDDTIIRTCDVTVNPVNDAPTLDAISDPAAIDEGAGQQTINLSGISVGPINENGQTLTVTASSSDTGLIPTPTVTYTSPNSTGTLTYTPVANRNGTAIITVIVTDNGQSNGIDDFKSIVRTFTVTVNAINDEPTLNPIADPVAINEDAGQQTVNLTDISAGPADENGQTLTVTVSSNNTALIPTPIVTYTSPDATGTLTYTPVADQSGTAIITVTVMDNGGTANGGDDTITRTFTVTVNATNDAPQLASIEPGALAYTENRAATPITGTITVSDIDDKDLVGATIAITGNYQNGEDVLAFTPVGGITGSFTAATGTLTLSGTASLTNYETVLRSVTYFNTSDDPDTVNRTVSFTVNDSSGPGNTVTRNITIAAVNDAPVANAQNVSTVEDTAKSITLVASDADGDTLTYSIVAQPQHGTLSGTAPNLTYTPAANYNGPDSFNFKANDGTADSNVATVTITVTATSDAPVAEAQSVTTAEDTAKAIVLAAIDNDGDALTYTIVAQPQHGTLSGTAPNLTYTPNANYSGPDSFTFKANDGALDSNVATVAITVGGTNDAPDAIDDSYAVNGSSLTVMTPGVLGNDTDAEGDALTAVIATNPTHGSVTLSADGSFIYTPVSAYNGTDSFTYLVSDGTLSDTATVTLTITGNDPKLTLAITPSTFGENAGPTAAIATLTRNGDTTQGLTVRLGSSDASEATVPRTIEIPSGATSLRFFIAAHDDKVPDGNHNVTILAIANNFPAVSAVVRVLDNGYVRIPLSLTVKPGGFLESAGSRAAIGEVSIPTAAKVDFAITLSSSDEGEARVPGTVTIKAGRRSASFYASAVDDSEADSAQPVTITARRYGFGTATKVIKVGDDDESSLLLVIDPNTISEGGLATGTVTRNRLLPLATTVLLSSSDPAAATVPEAVTIPAGQLSATFTLSGVRDGIAGNTRSATITASRPGAASDSATVTVVDGGPGAPVVGASRVALSTATARAATGSIVLAFNGALDADSLEAKNFMVSVDGTPVAVEGVSYDPTSASVTLLLADGSTHTGDHASVRWIGLFDINNAELRGNTTVAIW